jgi:hypothetical protein
MKVLLGIATYPTEPNIYPACQASLDALEWGEHEVWRVDYGNDDPKLSVVENLCNKHNRMRQQVLDGDYDALLTVEADMIVPPDALTKLAAVDADVALGLYVSRSSRIWLCIPTIDGYKGNALNADPAAARAAWGTVLKSEGAGFGCTLIYRKVLEAIEFRNHPKGKFADDWQFALDVKEKGFRMAHDLSVVCGHIIHTGGVLWPDIDAPELHRVEGQDIPQYRGASLPDVATYWVRRPISGTREYAPGDSIELDAEAAAILLSRRAIEIMEN